MAANRPLVYLLSGNGSTKAWWADALPHFRKKQPIALELPGFGDNSSPNYKSLAQLADALVEMTGPESEIFAVGINGLVVLHALVRHPGHFSKVYLLAPVGAFLWERRFVKWMSKRPIHTIIHFLLGRYPKLFRKKFSSRSWTDAQYARMGEGYRKCRAFPHYFRFVKPDMALDLFEWIETPIELIWGRGDAVLGIGQAAAWDSILPRADLGVTLMEDWEHYPYIDDPAGFAAWLDDPPPGFRAHTKAGRLELAALAQLPVPRQWTVYNAEEAGHLLPELGDRKYAVRSSGYNEDQIDASRAGLHDSFLRVPAAEVPEKVAALRAGGLEQVVVQEFVEPVISGVAFVRHLAAEVELVRGHLEAFISGREKPLAAVVSRMPGEWQQPRKLPADLAETGFSWEKLFGFLQRSIQAFHYAPSDIEWAWDGQQFHLFQLRPVTAYDWRRSLTSANLDEILPKQVSRIMEYAQRRASQSIPRVYAKWDPRVLNDNEPFSVPFQDASYINNDVFLARFQDWGLPSRMYAEEIGGSVPAMPFRLGRFLSNLPRFLRMGFVARKSIARIYPQLQQFEREFEGIVCCQRGKARDASLAQWFTRYYLFIVRQNMLINAAISSSGGRVFPAPKTVYQDLGAEGAPHRLKYESDPATPRTSSEAWPLVELPRWSVWAQGLHRIGAPGIRGHYIQVREWFRDNNMRLFHRLHLALRDSEWLEWHPGTRTRAGSFWQDGGEVAAQGFSFVIYPGKVEGVVGEDILVVDALEPGHYAEYQKARAVVSRTGGRLSHGATLLRELKKPSAVIGDLNGDLQGKRVVLNGRKLEVV
ncbi:MAG: PEP-utilizing enzyme [Bacteroidota bacterium]